MNFGSLSMIVYQTPGLHALSVQVFVEDVIERCVKYAKFQLQNTIFPDYDPVYRSNNKGSSTMKQKRAKAAIVKNKHSINLYNKMTQTIKLLAELSDQSELTDTVRRRAADWLR